MLCMSFAFIQPVNSFKDVEKVCAASSEISTTYNLSRTLLQVTVYR